VVWIFAFAALLAGVVAINVAVLRQNMALENLAKRSAELRAHTLELRSQLSQAASPSYVERLAQARLGLVQVAPDQTTYIRLSTGGK
jgi:cell division protein FtsB